MNPRESLDRIGGREALDGTQSVEIFDGTQSAEIFESDRSVESYDAARVVDFFDDDLVLPDSTRDDTDAGWGERPRSNDDRLLEERPPHWD